MYYISCSKEIGNNSKYCVDCGERINPEETKTKGNINDIDACPYCGEPKKNNELGCERCGKIYPENENYIHKKPQNDKTQKKNYAVLSVIVAIVVSGLIYAANYNSNDSYNNQNTGTSNSTSKSALIKETVKELKKEFVLPYKLDDATILVNITPQAAAIRYHYVLSGLDVNTLSDKSIKEFVLPGICSDTDIIELLNSGINLEYSYIVKENKATFFFTVTATDCI